MEIISIQADTCSYEVEKCQGNCSVLQALTLHTTAIQTTCG